MLSIRNATYFILSYMVFMLCVVSIVTLQGCSCMKNDKGLDIECKDCSLKYNHDRDTFHIKEDIK